jgi:TatD DNase family protein
MHFIDTHCHLDDQIFDSDRGDVLQTCEANNVRQFILPGVTRSQWGRMFQICSQSNSLFAAPGLHPCFLSSHDDNHISELENQIVQNQEKVVAVGECGIDLFEEREDYDYQVEVFLTQLELAGKLKLPLILHVRKAHDQVIKIIKDNKFGYGGVVHCFSGSLQQGTRYIDFGFKLGIGGVVTYERSHKLHRTISNLPLSAFVLETDAPDIPVLGRQKTRNSPEFLPDIFKAFVKYRPEKASDIFDQLFRNTMELFPKLMS